MLLRFGRLIYRQRTVALVIWALALLVSLPIAPGVFRALDAGGFSSPDELVVYCNGITPDRLELFRDRLVFLPM